MKGLARNLGNMDLELVLELMRLESNSGHYFF